MICYDAYCFDLTKPFYSKSLQQFLLIDPDNDVEIVDEADDAVDPNMAPMLRKTLGFSKAATEELIRQGIQSLEDVMQLDPGLMEETFKAAAAARMPNSEVKNTSQ